MFKLDNNFLVELGLGSLSPAEKNKMLAHIYETLEMRVGMRLAEKMTNEQLDEFEAFISRNDEAGALTWLETNFPNYKEVVAEELERLKGEIKSVAPQIVQQADAAQQNNLQSAPEQQASQSPQIAYTQQPAQDLAGPHQAVQQVFAPAAAPVVDNTYAQPQQQIAQAVPTQDNNLMQAQSAYASQQPTYPQQTIPQQQQPVADFSPTATQPIAPIQANYQPSAVPSQQPSNSIGTTYPTSNDFSISDQNNTSIEPPQPTMPQNNYVNPPDTSQFMQQPLSSSGPQSTQPFQAQQVKQEDSSQQSTFAPSDAQTYSPASAEPWHPDK